MKGRTVPIKFQYYEVKCANDAESVYDLRRWINIVAPLPFEKRLREVRDIIGRIEKIDFSHGEYYALNFMRMEVISNTYIVQEKAEASHIDLGDDEYIGKNTVALYDPRYNVMMIQCNRGSFGIAEIETYINEFQADSDKICLRPIFNNLDGILWGNRKALKIDVRFSNVRELQADGRFFERIVDSCREIECLKAHIEFSMGYDKNSELNKETISAFVGDLKKNRKGISSAKLVLSEEKKSNIFDLFENIDHDIIYFTCPERGELKFDVMANRMIERYNETSRARIANLVRGV